MSTNNIASQLLQGSRNIDRMREEIKQLVSMVLGSLRNDMVKHDPIIDVNWKFNFGDNEWQVTRVSGPLCHLKVLFVVWHGLKKDLSIPLMKTSGNRLVQIMFNGCTKACPFWLLEY